MFVGVHLMLAQRTNTPELAIGMDEGEAFMRAAQNVLRHYSVETTQKTLDWIAFAGVAGTMYGTRAVAISNRRAAERAAAGDQEQKGQVLRFRRKDEPQTTITPHGDTFAISPGFGIGELTEGEPA